MFVKGQLVYVYLNDLELSIKATKKINRLRFGHIEKMTKVRHNDKEFDKYTVRLLNGSNIIVEDREFKICSMPKLEGTLLSIKEDLTELEYENIMSIIQVIKK